MNVSELAAQISQKLGIPSEICEKVIKAFESQAGGALLSKLTGGANNPADMIAGIANKTGISKEDCEKIISLIEGTMGSGLADKLKFFK